MANIQNLPTSSIFPNPDQPRKRFDPAEMKTLASSITAKGLLQAITVVPRRGAFMIVAGERRWRATQLAGFSEITAVVREDLSDQDIAELALIENLVRADMNEIEDANAYQRLVAGGLTTKQIASRLGFESDTKILDRLALLKLEAEYQQALIDKLISVQQARQMAYLTPEGQKRVFEAIRTGKADTMSKLKRMVVAIYDRENQRGLFKHEDELSDAEKTSLSKVDRFIEGADRLCALMTDEDLQVIRMTLRSDAPRCIERLKLLASFANRLQLAIETSVAKFEDRESTATQEAA